MSTIRPTPLGKWLLLFTVLSTLIWGFYNFNEANTLIEHPHIPKSSHRPGCSPQAYAAGQWVHGPLWEVNASKNMTKAEDVVGFAGFTGCASSRNYLWHLASDLESQWDRFPRAQSYGWIPGEGCANLRQLNLEQLIKDLAEDGGWYLVGGE